MNICFVDGTSIINRVLRIDLGKLTCEQLNTSSWREFGILRAHLDFFEPFEDTTVAEYLEQNVRALKSVEAMKVMLSSNRYYQLNDEAANTFATVEALLDDTVHTIDDAGAVNKADIHSVIPLHKNKVIK